MAENKTKALINAIKWPSIILIIMWTVKCMEIFGHISFSAWGVWPRHKEGLIGILTGPFIHGSFGHLINNSIPFFVAGVIISYFYRSIAIPAIILIWTLTGGLVWAFAKPAFHIGASGVVYGMVSFIFWAGFFNRDRRSIVLALIILFLYSGMFYGVLPNQPGVSWESHLLGGLTGILTAYIFKSRREPEDDDWGDSNEVDFYFDNDTFRKTKNERLLEKDNSNFWYSNRS